MFGFTSFDFFYSVTDQLTVKSLTVFLSTPIIYAFLEQSFVTKVEGVRPLMANITP